MEKDYGGMNMTEREMLIMIMTKQSQMAEDLKNLKDVLSTKADAHRMEEIEADVKDLRKTQWVASGAVAVVVWVAQQIIFK